MIWRFSDGTTVELGGNVEGPTLIAQRLRSHLARPRTVSIWPPPGGDAPLDVNDRAILDAYLRSELDYWKRIRGLKLTLKRPDGIPPLPPPPWDPKTLEDGVVY
jgi:hypothetical protein